MIQAGLQSMLKQTGNLKLVCYLQCFKIQTGANLDGQWLSLTLNS